MLVAERHRAIVTLVTEKGSARVTELARQYGVTEETIRRDLERLEGEGRLLRSHGGAVALVDAPGERHYSERERANVREKIAIARHAVGLIREGDTVVLDASTTVLQIARLLPDLDLTVLTNGMQAALTLADRPRIRVICTGGALSPASLSFAGPQAEETLLAYHVHKAFFSCTGVDLEFGLSDINERQAMLKLRMMLIAERSYLLADSSKFGIKSLRRFARIDEIGELITDSGAEIETVRRFREAGTTVVVAAPSA